MTQKDEKKLSITDGPTNRPTDGPTDGAGCRVACTRLKTQKIDPIHLCFGDSGRLFTNTENRPDQSTSRLVRDTSGVYLFTLIDLNSLKTFKPTALLFY